MKNIIWLLLFITFNVTAQGYKSFQLLDNGDTLNRLDDKNMKQGKWKLHINALRLEPACDEEGMFVNNRKEGVWRKYDMYGLLIAKENYKWGNKNGLQQYLYQGQLEHEESWRASNPENQFDTIEVQDVYDQFKVERKIIKVDGYSLEHGIWKYYDPETGRIIKTVNYVLGKEFVPQNTALTTTTVDSIPKPKLKPKLVEQFEKNTKGKKKIIRDGSTGH